MVEFSGDEVTLKILNSEQAACKFVLNVPGSIALVETGSLQLPECSGPGQESYRLP
jgi:hypothetical protein